jgi:hypothetical protein
VRKAKAHKQAAPKPQPRDDQSVIHPDWFYRVSDAWKFFGYRNSVLHIKIATGEVPAPIALSDGGRARGWFGRTIIKWQQEREARPVAKIRVGDKP